MLADFLGLRSGTVVPESRDRHPSLVGHGELDWLPETRCGWLAELLGAGRPLLTDVDGRPCGLAVTAGAGRAVILTAELPSHPRLFRILLASLGTPPGLALQTTVPGVVVTTGATPDGQRMLHVLNPTGYPATVRVDAGEETGLLRRPLHVPARTGRILPLGLRLPGGERVVANAEIIRADQHRVEFSAGLGERTEVWLRTARPVTAEADIRVCGAWQVVTAASADPLTVAFGPS